MDEARLARKLQDLAEGVLPAQVSVPGDNSTPEQTELQGQGCAELVLPAYEGAHNSTPNHHQGSHPPTSNMGGARSDTLHCCLRQCHKLLIEPIAHVLETETRLLILPDDDLYALPFRALLDVAGKYLVEQYVLSIAPSVGTVLKLGRRAANNAHAQGDAALASALVVGDPDFHGWATQLRGARQEAAEVHQQLLSSGHFGDRITSLVGAQATKKAVVNAMCNSEHMHLSTHGDQDGVYLSGPTVNESKLTMAEVQELDLPRAKLVVLSECDSFKGKLTADGVIGIARAFLVAGASTLLATLWKVDDRATKVLMQASL